MLISLNWLKKYVDIKIPTDELVTLIGARLVEVEGIIDQTHKYDNILVAKVVSCEKIPDTHLSLCQIDAGKSNDLIQVVCGAPNVRAGMLSAWIAPGATVPASVHEDAPFIIGKRKLQGYESNGMLAGADELDFGDDHSGIVELEPDSAAPGTPLADIFDLNDIILEIENKSLTHRPDTFGIIGFAREVAGILGQAFKTPDFLLDKSADHILTQEAPSLKVTIADSKLCPRYTALILERRNAKSKKYLNEIDTLLSRSGMRPIDEIVDITNYLMLLTGQPLHAFDYDKLVQVGGKKDPEIIVRAGRAGDKLKLLDGHEVEPTENDIVITSNDIPVALAGAMGGENTEIDENTRRVVLESATFSLYNLRKTQMIHGVFSEAITRFTKGQPAFQTLPVAKEFAALMSHQLQPLALTDAYPVSVKPNVVRITAEHINNLLGTNFSYSQIEQTLRNVGFEVTCPCGKPDKCACEEIAVTAPLWRTDIHIPEDIIEEIGRLNGYDNIAPVLPLHATSSPNQLLSLKQNVRNALASFGANELLTYSFVHGDLLEKFGQDPKNSYKITNSISPDLQFVRQQITPSLLIKAYENLKDNHDHFAIFEMNQVFLKSNGLNSENVPELNNNLALVFADKSQDSCYYSAKLYLEQLLLQLDLIPTFAPIKKAEKYEGFYEPKRSAAVFVGETQIGIIGELKNSIAHSIKLPTGVATFELSLDEILALPKNHQPNFNISQFPSVNRDISLEVPADVNFEDVYQKIHQKLAKTQLIFSVSPISIFQKDKLNKSLTFHLEFSHPDKTLQGSEINAIMESLENIK